MIGESVERSEQQYPPERSLGWRTRTAFSQAVMTEKLREFDPEGLTRTPFRWSRAAPFIGWKAALSILLIAAILFPVSNEEKAHLGSWLSLVQLVIGLGIALLGLRFFRPPGMDYRQTCVAAYYGKLDILTRSTTLRSVRINAWGEDHPPARLRVRDARRWARCISVTVLVYVLVMSCAMSVTLLVGLWDAGLIRTVQPDVDSTFRLRVLVQVIWSLADTIPGLDLPSMLHWADPSPFYNSPITNVALVIVRVLIFAPIIGWIIGMCRDLSFDPREPTSADRVANLVIIGLADFEEHVPFNRKLRDCAHGDKWSYALAFASQELPEKKTPDEILDHLAIIPPRSVYWIYWPITSVDRKSGWTCHGNKYLFSSHT
jgi:hypothetical protein